jgi:hypothetical protein
MGSTGHKRGRQIREVKGDLVPEYTILIRLSSAPLELWDMTFDRLLKPFVALEVCHKIRVPMLESRGSYRKTPNTMVSLKRPGRSRAE